MTTPALLIIDVQKAIDDPIWGPDRNNRDAEQNIARLLTHWRGQQWPIFHIRHASVEPNSSYRPAGPGFAFKDEVVPHDGETIITKSTNSAFIATTLESELRSRGIDTVVITGVITNNSVEATVRMSGNLGFRTCVVADATATFPRRDFAGTLRTAEEVHAMSLANMDGEYATVVTVAEILAMFRVA